jgi:hypothetical protein
VNAAVVDDEDAFHYSNVPYGTAGAYSATLSDGFNLLF